MVPADMSQFRLPHLFGLTAAIAVAAAIYSASENPVARTLAISIVTFCIGMGTCYLSDIIDNRPMNDRRLISKAISAFGAIVMALSFLGLVLSLLYVSGLILGWDISS